MLGVGFWRILVVVRVAFRWAAGPLARRLLGLPPAGPTVAVRLRLALEELGLTYLKFGQYLSTRFDILPRDVCQELTKLLEHVRPISFSEVRSVIETELGALLEEMFPRFDPEPIASASVAQVHAASTRRGHRVAVKVQRPGIEAVFAADMANLRLLAALADAMHLMGSVSVREVLAVFEAWTRRELDFTLEGRTADRLRNSAIEGETAPRVYWELSTRRVLTLEFIDGLSLTRVIDLVESGAVAELERSIPHLDLRTIAHLLATACLNQLFVRGFFHGDPHPGNIIVLADNTIAFVDFGIFGALSEYQRHILSEHMEAIAVGDVDRSFRYYVKQMIPSPDMDFRRFAADGKALFHRWYAASRDPFVPPGEKHLGRFSSEMFDIVRRHRVRMTMDTLLFWRAINILAAMAVRMPEHFDLLDEIRQFFGATRPGLGGRLAQLWTAASVSESVAGAREIVAVATRAANERGRTRLVGRAELSAAPAVDKAHAFQTRLLGGLLAATSLVVAAVAPPLEAVRPLLGVASAVLFGYALVGLWRR